NSNRYARNHQNYVVRKSRYALIQFTQKITIKSSGRSRCMYSASHFIRNQDDRSPRLFQRGTESLGMIFDNRFISLGFAHDVGQINRQAIDYSQLIRILKACDRHVQIDWYFERLPSSRSALAMPLDPQLHLGIAWSGRSNEDHAPRSGSDSLCEATLATAYAAKHEDHRIRVRFLHAVAFNLAGTNWGDSKERTGPEKDAPRLSHRSRLKQLTCSWSVS